MIINYLNYIPEPYDTIESHELPLSDFRKLPRCIDEIWYWHGYSDDNPVIGWALAKNGQHYYLFPLNDSYLLDQVVLDKPRILKTLWKTVAEKDQRDVMFLFKAAEMAIV